MKNNNDKNSPLKYTGDYNQGFINPGYTGTSTGFMLNSPTIVDQYSGAGNVNNNFTMQRVQPSFLPVDLSPQIAQATEQAVSGGGGGGGIDFASNITPQMGMQAASGIGGIIQGLVGRTARRNAQTDAQSEYDKMMSEYRDLDTSNIYAGVVNKYRDMENTYEDLTVNQQQAQFERQMFEQQQANLMQGLSGAAGGSGIAALAQAMANQGQIQAQRSSASIGLQESKINMLQAQEASRLQQLERAGEAQAEALRLRGAETARGLDYQKTGTLLGMSQQQLAMANQAVAAGDAALYGGIGSLAGVAAMAAMSDRRLKKNIKLIGKSPSGLNIYNFEYIDLKYGSGIYQGVMSDEIPLDAVVNDTNGYDMVNYSMLDVEFKRIN
jgi:hypothetical protein